MACSCSPCKAHIVSLLIMVFCIRCELPLCRPGEHLQGKWVPDDRASVPAPFPCCGWDKHEYRPELNKYDERCVPLDGLNRDWNFTGSNEMYLPMGGRGCLGNCSGGPGLKSATWVPKKCQLVDFEAQAFCDLLGRRKLLIVGDSTGSQLNSFLANALHPICADHISFAAADTALGVPLGRMNRGSHWLHSVRELQPDIVLMSIGAHMGTNDDFRLALHTVYNEYLSLKPAPLLIWRTMNPAGCADDILSDYPRRLNADFTFWKSTPHFKKSHGWHTFEFRDHLAKEFFDYYYQMHRVKIPILDTEPLYLRADAHPASPSIALGNTDDCLHFCGAWYGPLRLVITLLHHILLDSRSTKRAA